LTLNIACFISPHGFGHAARACSVMATCLTLVGDLHFHLFTTAPLWFFEDSLPAGAFTYHSHVVDIGIVQRDAMHMDLPGTLRALDQLFPLDEHKLSPILSMLKQTDCRAVICDIAPLGLAAAHFASLPSILVENFTWDWIYESFTTDYPPFLTVIPKLRSLLDLASLHLQTMPICLPQVNGVKLPPISRLPRMGRAETRNRFGISHDQQVVLITTICLPHVTGVNLPPISRLPRMGRAEPRNRFGLSHDQQVVLITMGGIPHNHNFQHQLARQSEVTFIIPGGADSLIVSDNLILLPHRSPIHHPDLIAAADLVVGKSGYSTLAECYHAGVPYVFISRPEFRESAVLADFILHQHTGAELNSNDFYNGVWLDSLNTWLSLPRINQPHENGSLAAAQTILENIS